MPDHFELNANPQNMKEVAETVAPVQADMLLRLLKLGVSRDTAINIILNLTNLMKYYAHSYHELMVAGKVTGEDILQVDSSGFSTDVFREDMVRQFNNLFNKEGSE